MTLIPNPGEPGVFTNNATGERITLQKWADDGVPKAPWWARVWRQIVVWWYGAAEKVGWIGMAANGDVPPVREREATPEEVEADRAAMFPPIDWATVVFDAGSYEDTRHHAERGRIEEIAVARLHAAGAGGGWRYFNHAEIAAQLTTDGKWKFAVGCGRVVLDEPKPDAGG